MKKISRKGAEGAETLAIFALRPQRLCANIICAIGEAAIYRHASAGWHLTSFGDALEKEERSQLSLG
jgi:hypothetical protein